MKRNMTPEELHAWFLRLKRSADRAGDSPMSLWWGRKARQALKKHRCVYC